MSELPPPRKMLAAPAVVLNTILTMVVLLVSDVSVSVLLMAVSLLVAVVRVTVPVV